jgi:hypothetical protein
MGIGAGHPAPPLQKISIGPRATALEISRPRNSGDHRATLTAAVCLKAQRPQPREGLRPLPLSGVARLLLIRNQLDPAVLSAPFGRLVGGDEVRLPIAVGAHTAFCDAVVGQVPHHRVGAALGQLQVIPYRTDRVAIAIDVDRYVAVLLQDARGFIEHRRILRTDVVLVEIKVHATQD